MMLLRAPLELNIDFSEIDLTCKKSSVCQVLTQKPIVSCQLLIKRKRSQAHAQQSMYTKTTWTIYDRLKAKSYACQSTYVEKGQLWFIRYNAFSIFSCKSSSFLFLFFHSLISLANSSTPLEQEYVSSFISCHQNLVLLIIDYNHSTNLQLVYSLSKLQVTISGGQLVKVWQLLNVCPFKNVYK